MILAKRYTRHEVAAPRAVGPSGRTYPLTSSHFVSYDSRWNVIVPQNSRA
jgi:hypothetical protein